MKKLLLVSFLMTFTFLLGVTLAYDGKDRTDYAEQARIAAEIERMEALKTLTYPYQSIDGLILRHQGQDIPGILVNCPPGGTPEGEPDCYVEYDDTYNSGCNAADSVWVFVDIACGDTICGKSGVFRHSNPTPPPDSSTYRDTDWYRVEVTVPSELTWAATGDFPIQLLLIDAGSEDCVDYEILQSATAAVGDTASITITTWPGIFWLWVGPDDWYTGLACDGSGAGCPYVPGDANGVPPYNGLDITYGVAYFKGGPAPDCPDCPIGTCNSWSYCGDVNGSCNYNGLDITYGVAYFKGGPGPIFCADCPPGAGGYNNEYVAWVKCVPTPPCHTNTVIGDINSAVPYADLGNTTCGAGNDYFGASCIGPYWNLGEDYVYEFTVSAPIVLDIILDPDTTTWTSLVLDDFCPPDPGVGGCVAISTKSTAVPHGIQQILLQPGTYFVYVDKWAPTPCIQKYDLYIVEGVQTLGLAQTGNIPDCGVSNFGPLGEEAGQGNTYGWSGNDPANFAGTFVMGNSTTMMFAYYNTGVTDCFEYRGITGLNMVDPFHPTSRYDDNENLGGLSVEYCGHGYAAPPAADDIFVHNFKLTNNSGSAINNFYAGVYFDWDIDPDNGDTVFFDWTNNVMVQAPLDQSIFYGLCVVNADDVNLNSMTAVSQNDHIYPTGPSGGGWLMSELYTLMSTPGDSIADSMFTDMSSLLSTGPYSIANGDSVTIQIAVIGGATLVDVQASAAYAAGLTIPDCNVGVPPPPTGRCCYVVGPDTLCVNNLESECTGLGGYDWNRYLNCTDHPCTSTEAIKP